MLEKIKQAQISGRILPDVKVDYNTVIINNPIDVIIGLYEEFKKVLKENTFSYRIEQNDNKQSIKISYLKDFEPDFYRVELSTHDGTLCFVNELYEQVLKNILMGASYYKLNVPDDYNETVWNYDLDYTIGDIYYFRDFGIKNINGNNWSGEDDVMVMPVKVNYIKQN